jgi:uncharacterized protein
MPKLHFYDTGLACWLLGLCDAEQLARHPLRGALFETWVVSEIVKHRANAGERGGVYFYRDQNAVEADLLIDCADHMALVEAKAGQTVTPDMLSPAIRIGDTLGGIASTRAFVIYGGDTAQARRNVSVLPWSELHKGSWLPSPA